MKIRPDRHGYCWTQEESKKLRNEFKKGLTIETIADIHKRTIRSIECQLGRLGISVHKKLYERLVINNIDYDEKLMKLKYLISLKVDLM